MDANKDGTIDLEEWEKYMTPELKAAIQAKLDKSGDLSKEEIAHALNVLGLQEKFNIDDVLKTMDENSDGVVSIEEFKNGLPKEVLQAMSAALDAKGLISGV